MDSSTRLISPRLRMAALLFHLLLIAVLALDSGWSVRLLQVLPLLLPLPGLLRGRVYTFKWATMLLTFYVAGWLAAGTMQPAQKWLCFGIAALAALDFVALNLFVRFQARERIARTAASGVASR
ncbi:MAG TPA: DUF2069 domain-containing protein [Stenotrophobium sp.]|jgi:uncharacterized membrane protein|nr:DUF2069 domain-containing protein [Stenotrophobium sp.]